MSAPRRVARSRRERPRPLSRGSGGKKRAPRAAPRPLYTIGHSTRSADELVEILEAFGITRLVDVRSIPRSRRNPEFNRDVFPERLARAGIAYVHLAALGGRRGKRTRRDDDVNAGWRERAFRDFADYADTDEFRAGLAELLAMAKEEPCAILCAEAVWWRCHRRIVTDYVLVSGVPVVHVFTKTKAEPASLTPFAVPASDGRIEYPMSAEEAG